LLARHNFCSAKVVAGEIFYFEGERI